MIKLGYKKGGHDLGANLFDTFGLACLWPCLQPLDGTVARCGTFSRSNKRETNKNSKREDFLEGGRVFVLSCFFFPLCFALAFNATGDSLEKRRSHVNWFGWSGFP